MVRTSGPRVVKKNKAAIPKFVRQAWKLKDGDKIKFKLLDDGKVIIWKA
ncbi:MAG: type II toxin-antitoxin system PrlF family antitoxin [Candidatus Thermoplasmatota archaeon]|nr:type II toxin-antitoxin system PrlF family antitoxin [Candidatus Thermoplasmatota archaeon]MBU4143748.1 type II toxin-antitoxin system PrlF family antitoxin [Candidatus Thermoplasmatota archaeon]MBU4592431.1 type II toxin-antitoxin system PrlF family antitoxin [Candidatus Thermoplasmatota archaeon]